MEPPAPVAGAAAAAGCASQRSRGPDGGISIPRPGGAGKLARPRSAAARTGLGPSPLASLARLAVLHKRTALVLALPQFRERWLWCLSRRPKIFGGLLADAIRH